MIQLTKYANNKMYSPQHCKHVNLLELKEMLQSGEAVQVTDKTTGEDITAQVLSQVLVMTKNVNAEVLRQLIQRGE